ncbi:MAG: cobyrinate a,c-diamide synthase [Desulfovibrio sp.]|nr:cobyrinate a,c-diamide synthase [Desulfovibrio sp.]
MAAEHHIPPAITCPRLCISAARGGGGKTLVSLGLARALTHKGFAVKAFKKGPDYIDAAWLAKASRQPASNLDLFFLPSEPLCQFAVQSLQKLSKQGLPLFALLEGNRGLYDGQNSRGAYSTAELARLLNFPILLVVDVTKTTRTAAALIRGLTSFEDGLSFAGCVLNRVGTARQEALLRTCIEEEAGLPVLGAIPRLANNPLPERHMGLASSGEELAQDCEERLETLADLIQQSLDLNKLLACCQPARASSERQTLTATIHLEQSQAQQSPSAASNVRIAYVRDQAFWFYYPENLEALTQYGAELVPLRLLGDPSPASQWQEIHGLYLGGGFPEDYAKELAASPALRWISELSQRGLPIYAECGGFMLLARSLIVKGQSYKMCGVFPVDVEFCARPQGLGYVQACVTQDNPFFSQGETLRGHEFHYSRCLEGQPLAPMLSLTLGQGMGKVQGVAYDGLCVKRTWGSYTHIFAQTHPSWAKNFTLAARHFSQNA